MVPPHSGRQEAPEATGQRQARTGLRAPCCGHLFLHSSESKVLRSEQWEHLAELCESERPEVMFKGVNSGIQNFNE